MNQHQDYDKIIKENIEKISESIIHKICGITLEFTENISATIPKPIERRADFLKILITSEISIFDIPTGFNPLFHSKQWVWNSTFDTLLNKKRCMNPNSYIVFYLLTPQYFTRFKAFITQS
jgi:hypothetical protein